MLKGVVGTPPIEPVEEAAGFLGYSSLCHVGTPVFITEDSSFHMITPSAPEYFDFGQSVKWPAANNSVRSKYRTLIEWALEDQACNHLATNPKVSTGEANVTVQPKKGVLQCYFMRSSCVHHSLLNLFAT
jgi:hypothetical protein